MRKKIVSIIASAFYLTTLGTWAIAKDAGIDTKNPSVAKLKKLPYYERLFAPDLSEYSPAEIKRHEYDLICIDSPGIEMLSEFALTQGLDCFIFMNLALNDVLNSADSKTGSFIVHNKYWNRLNPAQMKTIRGVAALYMKNPKTVWSLYENIEGDYVFPFVINKMTLAIRCGKSKIASELYQNLLRSKESFEGYDQKTCDAIKHEINNALNSYRKSKGMNQLNLNGSLKEESE